MAPSASEAAAEAGSGESTIGWKLARSDRRALLRRFPPAYRNVVADHITLARAAEDAPLPRESEAEVIGRADDGRGVEALAVRLGSRTERPDGGIFHITWSLEPGREARESNEVLAEQGWVALEAPIQVTLRPARWP